MRNNDEPVACFTSRSPQTPAITIELEGEIVSCFRREAAKRGTSAPALVRSVLATAVSDNLIAAIIDVEEEAEPPAS
jgi:hypothetical protein